MRRSLPAVVAVDLDTTLYGGPIQLGSLRQISGPSGAVIAFAYDPDWLARPGAFVIDPSHGLYPGDQYPRRGEEISPIFTDSAPDRWGRTLLDRREALEARQEGRSRRGLGEWEYLLGVADVSRMGALRFRRDSGRYLADVTPSIPPVARLRELEAAARELERPTRNLSSEAEQLALLLAPGGSLGGARPKASYFASDGHLWLAKFPSRHDNRDMAGCEWVLNELAARAGIEVPAHSLLTLGSEYQTFAARRFDREGDARRLYASAMTMLSRHDREASSYLEIALAVADLSPAGEVGAQLQQLFRRVVFNVLTQHRDDHLRNHGFLRSATGWRLAPAFDLNPMPEMSEHELAIDESVHVGDIDLVIETASFYRLSEGDALGVVSQVRDALGSWRLLASAVHLGANEMEVLAEAIAV